MLQVQRLRILRRLERQRNSLAITLIHRQGTMSFLGFLSLRYIDINDAVHVLRAIRCCSADVACKALNQAYALVRDLLAERMSLRLSLPVRTHMPAEIYQFMEFFPQQTRILPSVEYMPHPERHGHGKRS